MGFGVRLKELLKQRGMTIKELSEKSGISINTLYSITKRDTKIPDEKTVKRIVETLQIQKDEILTYDVIKEDLKASINKIKYDEEENRQRLFCICQYLDSFSLLQLTMTAIDMLQDDSNHSFVNELPEDINAVLQTEDTNTGVEATGEYIQHNQDTTEDNSSS